MNKKNHRKNEIEKEKHRKKRKRQKNGRVGRKKEILFKGKKTN